MGGCRFLRIGVFLFIIFLLLPQAESQGAILRVKPTGNDANPGDNWVNAKKTVQAAINAAIAGDEIWVKAGTYPEHIKNKITGSPGSEVTVDMALYGGFAGTEDNRDDRNWLANLTILDGTNSGTVLTITGGAGQDTRVDGFHIINGNTGVNSFNSAPTLINNVIRNNNNSGIYIANYKFTSLSPPTVFFPVITYNTIINNTSANGAGIVVVGTRDLVFLPSSAPQITHNTIAWNSASQNGGGIGSWGHASPYIANNTIFANSSSEGVFTGAGGGIYATSNDMANQPVEYAISAPVIINNVITANGAGHGGGIYTIDTDIGVPIITNNTVVANNGSGICWSTSYGNYAPKIQNNLVAFNTWGLEQRGAEHPPTIKNNCVYGNTLQGKNTDYLGIADQTGINGNISLDPKMANYKFGELHLQPNSPCIDAGTNDAVEAGWKDIDGQNRVLGSAVDIGADESDGTLWNFSVPIIHVRTGGDDAQNGLTWGTAKKTVTAGIAAAIATSGEIWVAAGTYAEHITIPAFVYLYGGFLGNESSRDGRDVQNNITVLDGGGVHAIVRSKNAGYLVSAVDGFTIQNGGVYTGGDPFQRNGPGGLGGGIYISVAGPYITNNIIRRNSLAYDNSPQWPQPPSHGGGIYAYLSHAEISRNTITENEVLNTFDGSGGGIYCIHSMPAIKNNSITQNHARSGSAIYCEISSPSITDNIIENNAMYNSYPFPVYFGSLTGAIDLWLGQDFLIQGNTIKGNTAAQGAGIRVSSNSAGRIRNNLILNNTAYDPSASGGMGGGIFCLVSLGETLHIINNTIVGNTATYPPLPPFPAKEEGGGIAFSIPPNITSPPPYPGQLILANNIIAFNSSGLFQTLMAVVPPTFIHNDVFNTGANYINLSHADHTSDINVDPGFVNRPGGDFRLIPTSPCIDAGDNSVAGLPTTDYAGKPRIIDGNGDGNAVVDMGAYEFKRSILTVDYDSDGKTDISVWRPGDGVWYIRRSSDQAVATQAWGLGSLYDIPVPGDYDGDGKTDIAVWRPGDGVWYIRRSSDQEVTTQAWGLGSLDDIPVPGDYDGDGKADVAVWRPGDGVWYIWRSSDQGVTTQAWGLGSLDDIPVPGDYDGDGKTDIAVWRPGDGVWYIRRSSDQVVVTQAWGLGSLGDIPMPGDYDGDGKTDIAVWRPGDGIWYIRRSSDQAVTTQAWGSGSMSDHPICYNFAVW